LGFGPDVFADALVPRRRVAARRVPKNLETPVPATAWLHAGIRCADGYRFAKRHGKSNSANPTVIQQTSAFAISRRAGRQTRSDSIHRKA
jgi:hypothetical protein